MRHKHGCNYNKVALAHFLLIAYPESNIRSLSVANIIQTVLQKTLAYAQTRLILQPDTAAGHYNLEKQQVLNELKRRLLVEFLPNQSDDSYKLKVTMQVNCNATK